MDHPGQRGQVMTGDRRWPDDSPEEDAEMHRAIEMARLDQWAREQKVRPLTDALTEHGLLPGDDDGWAGPVILPDWWDEIPEPAHCCPWCQRPGVPSPCPECREARADGWDSPPMQDWWTGLAPQVRRVHIAAVYGVDPWSGRRCTITIEWTDVTPGGEVRTTCLPYLGCAPAGIFWGANRRGYSGR